MAHARLAPAFGPTPEDSRRLTRAVQWSVAIHVAAVVILLVVPRDWWSKEPERKNVMTISLGGSPGPRSTGTTSIGGRAIEEVAPPPKRPEPIRPTTPEKPPAPVSVAKPAPRPTTRPIETPTPPPVTATRPPVTGPQVSAGNTAVETGARGQGAGLSFGGGGSGGETDLSNFCCQEYLQLMLGAIESRWNRSQEERGRTVMKFTVNRNGSIDNVTTETSSGYGVLDRASRAALLDVRLPPLPAEYTNPTLTVHLTFPYGAQ